MNSQPSNRIGFAALLTVLVTSIAMLQIGCSSRARRIYGGGYSGPGTPVVTLESVTPAAESPRGWPVPAAPMPFYPMEMVRAGIAGEVTIRLTIGADGAVSSSRIVQSSQREFEHPVINATKLWRFRELPGLNNPESRSGMILDCRIRFAFDED
ncbi:MAG: TonB family protein [Verrucomicrobia bacterium]|nr:TonB family protein [Verrucomicrobiota bacterium]